MFDRVAAQNEIKFFVHNSKVRLGCHIVDVGGNPGGLVSDLLRPSNQPVTVQHIEISDVRPCFQGAVEGANLEYISSVRYQRRELIAVGDLTALAAFLDSLMDPMLR